MVIARKINEVEMIISTGDITEERVDAIVNAANENLIHGGGLAAAIVRKGGNIIQEESDRLGRVPTGQARATTGGKLHAKYVIHAVGPRWQGGNKGEEALLRSAVKSALEEASRLRIKSIAFPAISTGIFGYPVESAAHAILGEIVSFLKHKPSGSALRVVKIVLFDKPTYEVFKKALNDIL